MEHLQITSAPSLLALFETDKQQRQSFADNVITAIKEGEADPIKIHLQLKCTEDIIKQITGSEEYKKLLLEESAKRGKSFEFNRAKFETKEVGTKYDYSVCEDVEYNKLAEQIEQLKEKIKAREKFLQNIPDAGVADTENGNMIYKAAKSSSTTVAVTLK